jgi:long-chain acyl-CoA synthetase
MESEANLAQMFRSRSAEYADAVRWRAKRGDTWDEATWRRNQSLVNSVISGLDALGIVAGETIAIISGTRWEWMVADWGIIGLGGVTVAVYPSTVPATLDFILNDSGTVAIFAENQEQYRKLAAIKAQLPLVRKLILFDDANTVHEDDWVMSFAELSRLSTRTDGDADTFAAERAAAIKPDDRATLVYTSGTTGRPKGVTLTHQILMAQLAANRQVLEIIKPGMVDLLFLPLAHVFGREEHLAGTDRGLTTAIAGSLDTLAESIAEVKPDLFFSVPRIYEKAYAAITARVASGSRMQRFIFHRAQTIARKVSLLREQHRPLPVGLRFQFSIVDRLVFARVRAALGGRVKFAITAAAPLEVEILEFFNGAGVLLLEGWGMTETSGGLTLNRPGDYRFGTVGQVYEGHELRLEDDGEILVRGPCVFTGYHNNLEANTESFTADGWFRTGDIGTVDQQGFLRIVDRKKDLIITAGGKNIAPQVVENTLKKAPLVSQVAVYGDRKPYLVALVTLDPQSVGSWAAATGVEYDSISQITTNPSFRAYFDEGFQRANQDLASYETVKYYDILPGDFTTENELLTPTLKIRRRMIYQRYHELFESLYRPTTHEAAAPARRSR